MKLRAVVVIDWQVDSYRDAATEEATLESALIGVVQASSNVVKGYQFSVPHTPMTYKSKRRKK
mgnify:CR=1 FL=1